MMTNIRRLLWTVTKWADEDYNGAEFRAPNNDLEANVVGSLMHPVNPGDDSFHAPVIDIDLPCELIPSSHNGHFHLYINKPMTWYNYKKLLDTLYEVGIIQKGFHKAAVSNKMTMVRRPGNFKSETVKYDQLHTIRLEEVRNTLNGILKDMGHKEPPKIDPNEISF